MKNGIILNLSHTAGSVLIAAGFLGMAASPASASVLSTTGLGVGNNPAFSTSSPGAYKEELEQATNGTYLVIADPFTVSANATATDLLVALSLVGSGSPFNNGSELDFSIVSSVSGGPDADSAGNPISPLYTGAATGITGTTGAVYDVSLTGTATLVAGTTYWIVAKEPGVSPATGCPCKATYDEWYNNNSSTNTASDLSDFGTGWAAPNSQTNLAYTLEGSPTAPEPASLPLLSSGLLGLLFTASRLRRKSAAAGTGA